MSLIVDEEYLNSLGEYIKTQNEAIHDFISSYIEYMEELIEKGFSEGKTSDALKEFVKQLRAASDADNSSMRSQGGKAARLCSNYVSKIADADKDLY